MPVYKFSYQSIYPKGNSPKYYCLMKYKNCNSIDETDMKFLVLERKNALFSSKPSLRLPLGEPFKACSPEEGQIHLAKNCAQTAWVGLMAEAEKIPKNGKWKSNVVIVSRQ